MRLCVFGGRGRGLCVFGGLCVDMTIGDRWLVTNGYFFAVWLFLTIGTLLLHYWYSLSRDVTIGTSMVIFAVLTVFWLFFDHWCTNRHMSVKTVPTMYQQCTNRQKQWNSKKWPLVYQSSHVYTESAEYTQSAFAIRRPPNTAQSAKMLLFASFKRTAGG